MPTNLTAPDLIAALHNGLLPLDEYPLIVRLLWFKRQFRRGLREFEKIQNPSPVEVYAVVSALLSGDPNEALEVLNEHGKTLGEWEVILRLETDFMCRNPHQELKTKSKLVQAIQDRYHLIRMGIGGTPDVSEPNRRTLVKVNETLKPISLFEVGRNLLYASRPEYDYEKGLKLAQEAKDIFEQVGNAQYLNFARIAVNRIKDRRAHRRHQPISQVDNLNTLLKPMKEANTTKEVLQSLTNLLKNPRFTDLPFIKVYHKEQLQTDYHTAGFDLESTISHQFGTNYRIVVSSKVNSIVWDLILPLVTKELARCERGNLPPIEEDGGLIFHAPKMKELRETLKIYARNKERHNVIFRGPMGAGKTTLMNYLHSIGFRKTGPYVEVDGGQCSEKASFQSYIFGHKKGSYTSAHEDRPGRVEEAVKGTLGIDEIGNMTLETQEQLLKFTDTMVYEVLGAKTTSTADCNVFCATNKNIEEMIDKGSFRADLKSRLPYPVFVPGLNEIREQIYLEAVHKLPQEITFAPNVKDFLENELDYPSNHRGLHFFLKLTMLIKDADTTGSTNFITIDDLKKAVVRNPDNACFRTGPKVVFSEPRPSSNPLESQRLNKQGLRERFREAFEQLIEALPGQYKNYFPDQRIYAQVCMVKGGRYFPKAGSFDKILISLFANATNQQLQSVESELTEVFNTYKGIERVWDFPTGVDPTRLGK